MPNTKYVNNKDVYKRQALNIVNYTEQELKRAKGIVPAKVRAKLVSVLEKNPGFFQLCAISEILCGNEPGSDFEMNFHPLT